MLKSFTLPLTGSPRRLSEVYDAYRDAVLADGAVGYWRLNETSGTTAASEVGTYPGTIIGGVTLNQGGIAGGKAMQFNGTDATISMGDVAAFEFTGAFSVECWAKWTTAALMGLVTKALASTAGWQLMVTALGKIQFAASDSAATLVFQATTSPAYNDGAFHHVVATWTGAAGANQVTVYVDGVQVRQGGVVAGTVDTNAAPFRLGAGYLTPGAFFNGLLDEVAVYPTALTPQQILTHYQLGLPRTYRDAVLADGALAYWRLGELVGTSAFSEVGSFTGTIGGGVLLAQPGALLDGNTAMQFDGVDDFINVGDVDALEFPTGTVTFEFFAKFADRTAQRIVIAKSDWANTYLGWTLLQNQPSAGNFRLYVRDATVLLGDTVTNLAYDDGQWHHVAVTVGANWAPTATTWYVDGVAVLKSVLGGTGGNTGATTQPLRIGGSPNGPSSTYTWKGGLDEVAIYPTALTAAQIANHYALASVVPAVPAGAAMLDIPYRHLTLSAGPGPIRIGGDPALSSAFILDEATTPTIPLGRFSTGPLRLSDIWAVGAGATIHILGEPY